VSNLTRNSRWHCPLLWTGMGMTGIQRNTTEMWRKVAGFPWGWKQKVAEPYGNTRYNRLSCRFDNRFDNRLYRAYKHSAGCHWQPVWQQAVPCKRGLSERRAVVTTWLCCDLLSYSPRTQLSSLQWATVPVMRSRPIQTSLRLICDHFEHCLQSVDWLVLISENPSACDSYIEFVSFAV